MNNEKVPIWVPMCIVGFIFSIGYLIFYCNTLPARIDETKQVKFDRIMMQTWASYILLTVKEDKTVEITVIGNDLSYRDIVLVCDVPDGESMWLEEVIVGEWKNQKKALLHIHSIKDVHGANWNNGKSQGMTLPID